MAKTVARVLGVNGLVIRSLDLRRANRVIDGYHCQNCVRDHRTQTIPREVTSTSAPREVKALLVIRYLPR